MSADTASGYHFVDLFAGCGGLSLGLMRAGWRGMFAIEREPLAFTTLRHNLVEGNDHNRSQPRFDWPTWLKTEPLEISQLLDTQRGNLEGLRGRVHLVAGGPANAGQKSRGGAG